jgi:hypothetical protein
MRSFWTVYYSTSIATHLELNVHGSGVSVIDCSVGDTLHMLHVIDFVGAQKPFKSSVSAATAQTMTLQGTVPYYFRLDTAACASDDKIAISNLFKYGNVPQFLFTQTNFYANHDLETFDDVNFPLLAGATHLYASAISFAGITLVTDTGVFFWNTTVGLVKSSGLPASFTQILSTSTTSSVAAAKDRIGMKSTPYCDVTTLIQSQRTKPSKINLAVILWHKEINHGVYYSVDGGYSFSHLELGSRYTTLLSTSYVIDAAILAAQEGVAVLLRSTANSGVKDQFVVVQGVFSVYTDPHIADGESFDLSSAQVISQIASTASGSGEILVSTTKIHYRFVCLECLISNSVASPNGGFNFFDVALVSRDPNRPARYLATSETILQLATSRGGYFAVLTSLNRVFLGEFGEPNAYELAAGLNLNDVARLSFDNFDNLYVHLIPLASNTQSSAASLIGHDFMKTRVIPYHSQLLAPRAPIDHNPTLQCPYVEFSTDLTHDVYLDISQNLTFSVRLDPLAGSSNRISVGISNSTLLNFYKTQDVEMDASSSSTARGRSQAYVIDTVKKSSPGITDIRVAANDHNIACFGGMKTSLVRAQCPPGRVLGLVFVKDGVFDSHHLEYHIAGQGTTNCGSGGNALLRDTNGDYSIILPAGTYKNEDGNRGSVDKLVSYDCDRFGPPLPVFYSDAWRPYLGLFQIGNNGTTPRKSEEELSTTALISEEVHFLGLVTAEFVVYEVNLRTTFTFNVTQYNVNCQGAGQTWEDFEYPLTSKTYEKWTAETYIPCNDTRAGPARPNQPYEVMSLNGHTGLRWGGSVDGIYMFHARVIDSTYSFCDLTATFAVQVYGAPISEATQAYIVLSSISVMFVALGASYFWYRQSRRKDMFPITFGVAVTDEDVSEQQEKENFLSKRQNNKIMKSADFTE